MLELFLYDLNLSFNETYLAVSEREHTNRTTSMTSPRSRSCKSPTAANYLTAYKNNINFPRFIDALHMRSYTGRRENRRRKIRPASAT